MPYYLYRTSDNMGDSGQMSDAYHWPNGQENAVYAEVIHNSKPFVGSVIRVGTPFSRSFTDQDWWQTSMITEILEEWTDEENAECVRFKTTNSEYIWKNF